MLFFFRFFLDFTVIFRLVIITSLIFPKVDFYLKKGIFYYFKL